MASTTNWASVRMNMATQGPVLTSVPKSRLASDFCLGSGWMRSRVVRKVMTKRTTQRSEEHTSELQSLRHLVCRLLLEKKETNPYSYGSPLHAATPPPHASRLSPV